MQLVCEIATEFQRLYLCFRYEATRLDWSKYCRLLGWVRNQRCRPGTGSAYEITCSLAMRGSIKIPTVIARFLRSSNMTALVRILSYVRVISILKMAACNQKWIYTTNWLQILTWKSIRISPVILFDAKNISISVGISLLSSIQVEISACIYMIERNCNGYTYVFDVKQHDLTDPNSVSGWVGNETWGL